MFVFVIPPFIIELVAASCVDVCVEVREDVGENKKEEEVEGDCPTLNDGC